MEDVEINRSTDEPAESSQSSKRSKKGAEEGTARPRLLHSLGLSFLVLARKACRAVQDLEGPVGTVAKKAQWLYLLSSTDGRILAVEDAVASAFPPAARLFHALDKKITLLPEALPEKVDEYLLRRLPAIVGHLPFLGWVSTKCVAGTTTPSAAGGDDREIAGEYLPEDPMGEEKLDSSNEEELQESDYESGSARSCHEDIREVEEACKVILQKLQRAWSVKEEALEKEEGLRMVEVGIELPMEDLILELFEVGWSLRSSWRALLLAVG
ncbi:unnamed protein product [Spirodela intermedia]|uniref:Uncharacterized protein n=1 Tax=Spirodela intermedia TaxID=51605 RepID=A0A7I8IQ94_SPIIN|nr:unnamed protein product [Spirodela intermedia]CAA6660100.1 unnamed protein product [Spirodela intermedia]